MPPQLGHEEEKGAPEAGPGLHNSQELDSGVGRTDESTRNEESSEHDLLGDEPLSTANTPGPLRKFGLQGDALQSRDFHFSMDSLLAEGAGLLEKLSCPTSCQLRGRIVSFWTDVHPPPSPTVARI